MKTCLFRLYPFQELPFGTGSFSGTVCQICFSLTVFLPIIHCTLSKRSPIEAAHARHLFFSLRIPCPHLAGLWLNYSYTQLLQFELQLVQLELSLVRSKLYITSLNYSQFSPNYSQFIQNYSQFNLNSSLVILLLVWDF